MTEHAVNSELATLKAKLEESGKISRIGVIAFGGSWAYGLNTPDSDIDLRGFALPTARDVLLMRDFEQVASMDGIDATVYSLRKVTSLLLDCNPNVIELLGLPDDAVLVSSDVHRRIVGNKSAYLSRKAAATFGGYATAQLRRIQNSMNRDGMEKHAAENALRSMESAMKSFPERYGAPGRSVALHLDEDGEGRSYVSVDFHFDRFPAKRLRGLAGELDDINKNAENLCARNRKKSDDKLSKHASHLLRLLFMGAELLETGEVNTRRESDRELLIDVKRGRWLSEGASGDRSFAPEFWELLDDAEKRFEYAKANTCLPGKPDADSAWDLVADEHRKIACGM